MRRSPTTFAAVLAAVCAVTLGSVPAAAGPAGAGASSGGPASLASRLAPSVASVEAVPTATADPLAEVPTGDVAARRVRYVTYVYRDLLGRDPEPAGLTAWVNALSSVPRADVAVAISHSREYRELLVTGVYQWYLGRPPDRGGLSNWADAMERGWTVARIEAGFLASDEFYANAGGTPASWVTDLYRSVLEREPAPSEVQAWVRALARENRYQVAMGFLLSWERLSTVVDGYYVQLLRRHLDRVGQRGWVSALQAGHHDEEIIAGIIGSDEYWGLTGTFPEDLVLSPADSTAYAGRPQVFTVEVPDDEGGLVDATAEATVRLDGRRCAGATCTSSVLGLHVVSADIDGVWTATLLTVTEAPFEPGPLDAVELSPATVTVADGASVVYTAEGFDATGYPLGDVTDQVTLAVDGDPAACDGARCRPVGTGEHTVTVVGLDGTATVTMSPPGPQGYTLWGWGTAEPNRLLPGETARNRVTPGRIDDGDRWAAVAGGGSHALALKTDGSVWAWGDNWGCSLGGGWDDADAWRLRPEQVGTDTDWVSVAAGGRLSFGIKADGSLWAWGSSPEGGFGVGDTYFSCEPRRIAPERAWSSVVTDGANTLAIAADGSLWSWGRNTDGQLGDGTTTKRLVPTLVAAGPWAQVSIGADHVLALKADGSLWAWGGNSDGRLGTGNIAGSLVPIRAGADTDWVAVAAGGAASFGVKRDGSLWAWGTVAKAAVWPAQALSPVRIEPGRPWQAVRAHGYYTLALGADGTLWGWGQNLRGQLGNGTEGSGGEDLTQAGTGGWVAVATTTTPMWEVTLALREPAAGP